MRERIDPLIAERAPWLFERGTLGAVSRHMFSSVLGYSETIELAHQLKDLPASEIFALMGKRLAKDVELTGLGNVPNTGPALILANHPTGIADGIILNHMLSRVRSDVFIFANSDILRVFPQLDEMIVPVEWREEKRNRDRTRRTLSHVHDQVGQRKLGIIFPSGRLAKRRGLTLYERPWMPSAVSIARKYDLPIIPVNIKARNSALFYLFDLLHPTLRDITLFHETLNKDKQPFRIAICNPIHPKDLTESPSQAVEEIARFTVSIAAKSGASRAATRKSLTMFDLDIA